MVGLEATDITVMSCNLTWSPPEIDGGSEVTHYIVEKREVDRKTWATVKTDVDKTTLKVSNLVPGTEYYFRVIAVNEYGPGVPKPTPRSYLASDPISKHFDNRLEILDKVSKWFSFILLVFFFRQT